MRCRWVLLLLLGWPVLHAARLNGSQPTDIPKNVSSASARPPVDEQDLRRWLENMVWYHRFTNEEIELATGLSQADIQAALTRFQISPDTRPEPEPNASLVMLPYPGGRHPRIGFRDGAVRPQRDTKLSVFTPWDPDSYVVLDVPEAIWSNLGLTYLAHEHIPTIWDQKGIRLEPREWMPIDPHTLQSERRLPNGIRFGTRATSHRDRIELTMWLQNGTDATLTGLRVQNCVLLKGAKGFAQQTNDNKVFRDPYVVCRADDSRHWIITAWIPLHRGWANAPCPCLHSDPQFPDCPPGETVWAHGWLSFYVGSDLDSELERIERTGWRENQTVLETGRAG